VCRGPALTLTLSRRAGEGTHVAIGFLLPRQGEKVRMRGAAGVCRGTALTPPPHAA
jgi:hypothetical protein